MVVLSNKISDTVKAKRIDNGEWVVGYYCPKKPYCFDNRTPAKDTIITEFSSTGIVSYEIDPKTICHSISGTDKTGIEIFENDIVKKEFYTDWDAYANSEEFIGVVKMVDHAWCICFENEQGFVCTRPLFIDLQENMGHDAEHYVVIGNAIDNPELLKTKEKDIREEVAKAIRESGYEIQTTMQNMLNQIFYNVEKSIELGIIIDSENCIDIMEWVKETGGLEQYDKEKRSHLVYFGEEHIDDIEEDLEWDE